MIPSLAFSHRCALTILALSVAPSLPACNCPDADGDEVCDAEDLCPGHDDNLDPDDDGIASGCDLCLGDNDSGDSDEDGICDAEDLCPDFDDRIDGDQDGIPDGCDTCFDADNDGACVEEDCDDLLPSLQGCTCAVLDGFDGAEKIVIDSDGGKWFSHWHSLSYLDDNGTPADATDDVAVSFSAEDGVPYGPIIDIAAGNDGGLWFIAGRELYFLDHGGTPADRTDDVIALVRTVGCTGEADSATHIVLAPDGSIWIGMSCGVFRLDDSGTPTDGSDDHLAQFTCEGALAGRGVMSIAFEPAGGVWVGTWNGALFLDVGVTPTHVWDGPCTNFEERDGLVATPVDDIAIDADGNKWFVSDSHLSFLDDGDTPGEKDNDTWIAFGLHDSRLANDFSAMAIDDAGRKWFAADLGEDIVMFDDNATPVLKRDDNWVSMMERCGGDGFGYAMFQTIAITYTGTFTEIWATGDGPLIHIAVE